MQVPFEAPFTCGRLIHSPKPRMMPSTMDVLRIILQVFQAFLGLSIIVLVMLHSPKGDGIGAIGGAAQLFSSQKGAEATLNKTTGIFVGLFYAVSFLLGYYF
jgi:preprotein translocase subunit SecG